MLRKRLYYVPVWEGPIEGWVTNYSKRNEWRVVPEFDMCDLHQEAYLIFMRLKIQYVADDPAHFMALMKVSFFHKITDMANRRTRRVDYAAEGIDEAVGVPTQSSMIDAELRMLLEEAPIEIIRLVNMLGSTDKRPPYKSIKGKRETTAEYLSRLAGVVADPQLPTKIMEWVKGEPTCQQT